VTPCVIHEDEHLLVVNKPAGMNTHAPGPYAGEGIYEWLKNREPRYAELAIIHRLDKDTSGLMVFGKTRLANRSLTEQFTERKVRKEYRLVTDRPVKEGAITAVSSLVRAGEKYLSRPLHAGGERAETRFRVLEHRNGRTVLMAEPLTGRTHQIRVHAAAEGFPILGDVLYGGTVGGRVCLHAEKLTIKHPATEQEMSFSAAVDFEADTRLALREALIDANETNAWRVVHGAADRHPGWYVERLGDFLLSQAEDELDEAWAEKLSELMKRCAARGAYHKVLTRRVRQTSAREASPRPALGEAAPAAFKIRENGINFELSFSEGYSVGLFLDQRDNRRRFLNNHIAPGFPLFKPEAHGMEVLNAFAYTCGFSVCAAMAGARATSLDLSKKYLEWGRRNFALNGLDPAGHDFIYGDAFEWLRRLARKQRRFHAVILDPPTFSQSKEHGTFQAEKDYGKLISAALPVLERGGVLLASTNAARLDPERFAAMIEESVKSARRKIVQRQYVPQPPDFPITREEPSYLKTIWLRID